MAQRVDRRILDRGVALVDPIPVPEDPPRCAYCGGVIGVYEPAIQLLGGAERDNLARLGPGPVGKLPWSALPRRVSRAQPASLGYVVLRTHSCDPPRMVASEGRRNLPAMAAVFNLNHPAHFVHWHFFQMSVSNIIVIVVMLIVFVLAILLPFPRAKRLGEGS